MAAFVEIFPAYLYYLTPLCMNGAGQGSPHFIGLGLINRDFF
jgi:hypothetical protein